MKKIVNLLALMALVLSFSACSSDNDTAIEETNALIGTDWEYKSTRQTGEGKTTEYGKMQFLSASEVMFSTIYESEKETGSFAESRIVRQKDENRQKCSYIYSAPILKVFVPSDGKSAASVCEYTVDEKNGTALNTLIGGRNAGSNPALFRRTK